MTKDSLNSLIEQVESSRKAGATDEQITRALVNAGWGEKIVKKAIKARLGLRKRIYLSNIALGGKMALILLLLIVFLLVFANTYLYVEGNLPLFGSSSYEQTWR